MKTFEEWLSLMCPCHTNNSSEGFENWVEQLDIEELISLADSYGKNCFSEGKIKGLDRAIEITKS